MLSVGRPGAFEVRVDGELVAERSHGFFTRLVGGGWPRHEDVLEALRRRQRSA